MGEAGAVRIMKGSIDMLIDHYRREHGRPPKRNEVYCAYREAMDLHHFHDDDGVGEVAACAKG